MISTTRMPCLDDLERIPKRRFFDDFDSIIKRVDKEKTAFIIESDSSEYVICPFSWLSLLFDNDLGEIINSAVRYSLGRQTYMPSVIHDCIIRNISLINAKTLSIIISDVDREIQIKPDLYNKSTWISLRDTVKSEIELRKTSDNNKESPEEDGLNNDDSIIEAASESELNSMQFIGTKEVARLMGCSVPVARQIMNRRDFPLIKCGKNLKVMKSEFIKWASERRI